MKNPIALAAASRAVAPAHVPTTPRRECPASRMLTAPPRWASENLDRRPDHQRQRGAGGESCDLQHVHLLAHRGRPELDPVRESWIPVTELLARMLTTLRPFRPASV